MSQVEAQAGVGFHSVAGESCCAGVQVFDQHGLSLCLPSHVAVYCERLVLFGKVNKYNLTICCASYNLK